MCTTPRRASTPPRPRPACAGLCASAYAWGPCATAGTDDHRERVSGKRSERCGLRARACWSAGVFLHARSSRSQVCFCRGLSSAWPRGARRSSLGERRRRPRRRRGGGRRKRRTRRRPAWRRQRAGDPRVLSGIQGRSGGAHGERRASAASAAGRARFRGGSAPAGRSGAARRACIGRGGWMSTRRSSGRCPASPPVKDGQKAIRSC